MGILRKTYEIFSFKMSENSYVRQSPALDNGDSCILQTYTFSIFKECLQNLVCYKEFENNTLAFFNVIKFN